MGPDGRNDNLNLPNTLSLIRILAAPVLIVLLLSPGEVLSFVAAVIFALVCITDWLDGYFARKRGLVTSMGKFLDPLADKLLINTAFIMLIPLGRVPAWVVALIVGREIAVTGLRAVASNMGIVIAAGTLGKYKTAFQIVALVALILHYPFFGVDFRALGVVFLVIAFVLTMWSGADYFLKFFRSAGFEEG
ncbi:MAG TPA: CDP-diacylglycerol--glycerol-3-phosphate 3-phosphatidyltransferase [Thermodesulfobacteriota bacterium]|nr:CDP-diacylglycerol--glycerol-3-phosphate 3-phosphatidyltransferase [Thermodesulfobacteriota bacterium]